MRIILDLKITNAGDLILEKENNTSKFKISFVKHKFPVLKMNFRQLKENNSPPKTPPFCIAFYTNLDKTYTRCSTIENIEELKQRIMIRLRTEKGDLNNNTPFGSTINALKHQDITDIKVQDKLKEIVLKEVSELLDDPIVKVKYTRIQDPFFCENLTVYIYNGLEEIYNFML